MPFIDNKVIQGVFTPEKKRELVERVSEAVITLEREALPPSPTPQSPKPEAGNGRSGDRIPQPAGEARPVRAGVVPDLPVPIVLAALPPGSIRLAGADSVNLVLPPKRPKDELTEILKVAARAASTRHSPVGLAASTATACWSSQEALQPSSSANLASAAVRNSASG